MVVEDIQTTDLERLKETPYGARKTAELDVQYAIDISKGLTKQRLSWYSNGTLHDNSLFTQAGGAVNISTTATGTDTARIRPALVADYQGQSLAEPGHYMGVASANTSVDSNGLSSISHGKILSGAYLWDEANTQISTGFGLEMLPSGINAVLKSGGVDKANSPVPQEEWNIDPMDGTGPSGITLRLDEGYVYNYVYTWYGDGALILAIKDTSTSDLVPFHAFDVNSPEASLDTPNIQPQVYISNEGTAQSLTVQSGEMQYALYGTLKQEVNNRFSPEEIYRGSNYISTNASLTNNRVDLGATPGTPIASFRRDPNSQNSKAIPVEFQSVLANTDSDIYIVIWNEWEPNNALTNENFTPLESRPDNNETKLLADGSATDYTPTDAVAREIIYSPSNKSAPAELTSAGVNNRLPFGATFVITGLLTPDSTKTTPRPLSVELAESY